MQSATHPKEGHSPAGFPTELNINITPETTDEQIKSWAKMQSAYDFHIVENLLFLERRVAQLEERQYLAERTSQLDQ